MDCWKILGIEPCTNKAVIKKAFAQKVKENPPSKDAQKYQKLREAYDRAMKYSPAENKLSRLVPLRKQNRCRPYPCRNCRNEQGCRNRKVQGLGQEKSPGCLTFNQHRGKGLQVSPYSGSILCHNLRPCNAPLPGIHR